MMPVYRPDLTGRTENEIGKVVVGLYSSREAPLTELSSALAWRSHEFTLLDRTYPTINS